MSLSTCCYQCIDCTRVFEFQPSSLQIYGYDATTRQFMDLTSAQKSMLASILGIQNTGRSIVQDSTKFHLVGENDIAMDYKTPDFFKILGSFLSSYPPKLRERLVRWFDPAQNNTPGDPLLWHDVEKWHKINGNITTIHNKIVPLDDDEDQIASEQAESNDGKKMDLVKGSGDDDSDDSDDGDKTKGGKRQLEDDDKQACTNRQKLQWYYPECILSLAPLSRKSSNGIAVIFYTLGQGLMLSKHCVLFDKPGLQKHFKKENYNPSTRFQPVDNKLTIPTAVDQLLELLHTLQMTDQQLIQTVRLFREVFRDANLIQHARQIVDTLVRLNPVVLGRILTQQDTSGWTVPKLVYNHVKDDKTLQTFTNALFGPRETRLDLGIETLGQILIQQNTTGWTVPMVVYHRVNDADTLKMFTTMLVNTLDTETIKSILLAQNNDGWTVPMFVYRHVTDEKTLQMFTNGLFGPLGTRLNLEVETLEQILTHQTAKKSTVSTVLYVYVKDDKTLQTFTNALFGPRETRLDLGIETLGQILIQQNTTGWTVLMVVYNRVTDDKTLQSFTNALFGPLGTRLDLGVETFKQIMTQQSADKSTVSMFVYNYVKDDKTLQMFTNALFGPLKTRLDLGVETLKQILTQQNNIADGWTVPTIVYTFVKDHGTLRAFTDGLFGPRETRLDSDVLTELGNLKSLELTQRQIDQMITAYKQSTCLFSPDEIKQLKSKLKSIVDQHVTDPSILHIFKN